MKTKQKPIVEQLRLSPRKHNVHDLIVEALSERPLGFNELAARLIHSISKQTLSAHLKNMVYEGKLKREPEGDRKGQKVWYMLPHQQAPPKYCPHCGSQLR